MENGFLVLGIIALLFLSIYGYSYFSVYLEKQKQKKVERAIFEKKQQRREARLQSQALMEERVRKFNKRKEEIQKELISLKEMKISETQKVG